MSMEAALAQTADETIAVDKDQVTKSAFAHTYFSLKVAADAVEDKLDQLDHITRFQVADEDEGEDLMSMEAALAQTADGTVAVDEDPVAGSAFAHRCNSLEFTFNAIEDEVDELDDITRFQVADEDEGEDLMSMEAALAQGETIAVDEDPVAGGVFAHSCHSRSHVHKQMTATFFGCTSFAYQLHIERVYFELSS